MEVDGWIKGETVMTAVAGEEASVGVDTWQSHRMDLVSVLQQNEMPSVDYGQISLLERQSGMLGEFQILKRICPSFQQKAWVVWEREVAAELTPYFYLPSTFKPNKTNEVVN